MKLTNKFIVYINYDHRLTGSEFDIYHRLIYNEDAVGSLDECAARCNSGNGELLAKQTASLDNETKIPQPLYSNFLINCMLHIKY